MTVIPFDARKERFTIKIKLQEIWMGIGADARSKMLVFCCVSSSPVNSPENPNETSAPIFGMSQQHHGRSAPAPVTKSSDESKPAVDL
jgi:hypothetical protein